MRKPTATKRNRSKRFLPILEILEGRETPVVGAFSPVGVTTNPLYDGVVLINATDGTNSFIGTGTLLIGRTHILTAAHVVTDDSGNKLSGSVDFVFGSGGGTSIPYSAADVTVLPSYNPVPGSNNIVPNDVALIRLTSAAPGSVTAFDLYRNTDEIGQAFTMVGFGETGTGADGESTNTSGVKRMGTNTFEATGNVTDEPAFFRNLAYDFDDGTTTYNEFSNTFGVPSNLGETSGATLIETAVGSGDSGGPGFINVNGTLYIAGIVSGSTDDSRFGSNGDYARVSAYARAIDLIVGTPNTGSSTTNFAISPSASPSSVSAPVVKIYDSTIVYLNNTGPNANNAVADVMAYDPGFTGGVTVAMGDVNHDGFADLITATGPGGGPHIKVFSGADYETVLYSFFAFEPTFTGGLTIASGDTNNDGYWDMIVGAGPGGGPRITVFSGLNLAVLQNFFAFEPTFTGGVQIATGKFDADPNYDIIVGAGAGGGPRVTIYNGSTLAVIQNFFVYDIAFTGGIFVAAGNVGGGLDKIIVGAGAGGGPNVRVFDNAGNMLQNFFAYAPAFMGGVRVASGIMSVGGTSGEIITVPGAGGGPNVSAFNSASQLLPINFFAFDPTFVGGLYNAGVGVS